MVNVIQQAIEALRGVIRVADRATVEFDAAKAALASLRAAQEGDLPPLPEKRTIRGNSPKGYAPRDMHNYARLALAAAGGGVPQEPARPDILERLSYHALERDDLTLDECLDYLAKGWAKVHGRTERQMVMQIHALLASSPQPEAAPAVAQVPMNYDQMREFIETHADYNIAGWRVWGMDKLMDFIGKVERAHGIAAAPNAPAQAPALYEDPSHRGVTTQPPAQAWAGDPSTQDYSSTVAAPSAGEVEAMRNALRSIREHCAVQPSALAKSIVVTCDAALSHKEPQR